MSRARAGSRALFLATSCGALLAMEVAPTAMAQSSAGDEEFLYRARNGDTLIGLGRRLLREPVRWRDLQIRNRIADPRRIPLGATIRIPYAWLRMSAEVATVNSLAGGVVRDGNPIRPGETVPQGSVIETHSDGSVTLDLADGSVVTLQRSTVLQLDEMQRVTGVPAAHDVRLRLRSGRLQTAVKPHGDVGRFQISTPVAVSAARGTEFRATFDAQSENANTETLEGAVGVEGSVGAVLVPAGFGTRVAPGTAPLTPVRLLPPPDLATVPQTSTQAQLRVRWPSVAGARAYRIQVAPDAQFHSIAADIETELPEATLAAPNEGRYWLRARSIDSLGLEGPDGVREFTQHTVPAPPVPLTPAPGAQITGGRVSFAWTPAAPGLRYRLQVARDATFSDPVLERETGNAANVDIDGMQPGHYVWRVASVDPRGEAGDWGPANAYIQQWPAPSLQAVVIEAHELQLRWDERSGQRYHVQVARDSRFEHLLLDRTVDAPAFAAHRPRPGFYYARVQTVDPDRSATPFGAVERFEVPVPTWLKILLPIAALLTVLI